MTRYGYSLMCELHHPNELLAQARRAEEAGFDFLTISDHIHPWLYSHKHSAYAWSVLGALAAITTRVELVSLVTCPTIRYHPVIVAQKAATIAAMSGGRFHLGLGAGENLNEHVVGQPWPPAHIRHEMLEEAVEIIRALWGGGYHSYDGKHFTVYDARVFTLPDEPPPLHVAASGPASVALAARSDGGIITTEPNAALVESFVEQASGNRPCFGQLAVSIDDDEQRARRLAHERFRFAASGWKVQSELPNPINFEAATAHVTEEDVAGMVSCGPDPERHLEAIRQWTDAGFDHVAIAPVADPDRFFAAWERDLRPNLA
ncbi:MAG: F420-dependent glucose-6-phosphate dehydrogenase [uncultured Solirubrobacteraceae bacterium]|uniref:F420-dependent glucose-6-phosphate dehydrogenase n=1 Tax=uncultured Solirubrobacteraceae bacterium TaxID=1162706 RepID=A0A6J4SX05_9ACTN|nr:MAG: F420-dependent glucose-6-phosphate dehydrogenase [uncultured Solirubrobacteraceae bacterium]